MDYKVVAKYVSLTSKSSARLTQISTKELLLSWKLDIFLIVQINSNILTALLSLAYLVIYDIDFIFVKFYYLFII